MKYLLVVTVALILTQVINCAEEDYNYGDDADPDAGFEPIDETPKPMYNLKDAPELFKKFIRTYSKKYENQGDTQKHYKTFVNNLKEINRFNSDPEFSASVDINLFTDLTNEERLRFGGILGL